MQRLRTENRLLRQRVDLLEQESSNLADRLIQGQVTRAEVEEHTFAIKRELAAIRQHDFETSNELENARQRIRKLSEIVETKPEQSKEEELSMKSEIIRQKEEMINCLQDELIKVRLREAENEERIRNLGEKVSELEEVRNYCLTTTLVYGSRGIMMYHCSLVVFTYIVCRKSFVEVVMVYSMRAVIIYLQQADP